MMPISHPTLLPLLSGANSGSGAVLDVFVVTVIALRLRFGPRAECTRVWVEIDGCSLPLGVLRRPRERHLWAAPRQPRRWSGKVAVEVYLCAIAVFLASCGGSPGGNQTIPGVWRTQTSGTHQRLDDVACLSALRCEAVGEGGTIVATADGGVTWRAQGNPLQGSPTEFYRITCVAPSACYIIARPDTILVTHDGGSSWVSHVLPVGVMGSNLTDSACLPNYTTISGRPALCRLGLLDIDCVSASVCYAVATASPAYGVEPWSATAPAAGNSIWMTDDWGSTCTAYWCHRVWHATATAPTGCTTTRWCGSPVWAVGCAGRVEGTSSAVGIAGSRTPSWRHAVPECTGRVRRPRPRAPRSRPTPATALSAPRVMASRAPTRSGPKAP